MFWGRVPRAADQAPPTSLGEDRPGSRHLGQPPQLGIPDREQGGRGRPNRGPHTRLVLDVIARAIGDIDLVVERGPIGRVGGEGSIQRTPLLGGLEPAIGFVREDEILLVAVGEDQRDGLGGQARRLAHAGGADGQRQCLADSRLAGGLPEPIRVCPRVGPIDPRSPRVRGLDLRGHALGVALLGRIPEGDRVRRHGDIRVTDRPLQWETNPIENNFVTKCRVRHVRRPLRCGPCSTSPAPASGA
jgi:hypothetical protein